MSKGYESLANEIYDLYVTHRFSKSEIARIMGISRDKVRDIVNELNLTQDGYVNGINSKTKDFIDTNRNTIIEMLNNDESLSNIARTLGVDRGAITRTCVKRDVMIRQAYEAYHERRNKSQKENREKKLKDSSLEYDYEEIEGEVWKDIEDYPGYQVSNMGRVRHYAKRYKAYHLIKPEVNVKSQRYYVTTYNKFGKKNWSLARLVAIYHVPGFSELYHDTVNHEDGDVSNNKASNLVWLTQRDNNLHAFLVLKRGNGHNPIRKAPKGYRFNGKEYKTLSSIALDLGIPISELFNELREPENCKYDIEVIEDENEE